MANLEDGESIVLERKGDLVKVASRIRNGLNGIGACTFVRCTVKVVYAKIAIPCVGTWPTLGAF